LTGDWAPEVSEPPISHDLPVGFRVGAYRIESLLGRGGMAVVYEATDSRLERRVALKVLMRERAESPEFRKRFLREAHFAASLDHPNIVPIYDTGAEMGSLYIAMRCVRGGNLAALLRRSGPLEPGHALAVLAPVADALDAAHAAGLIHRDVKPANILLSQVAERHGYQHVYLSDFGLTRYAAELTKLTGTGNLIGTLDYIAPEQIRGQSIDARTDLYALGCVAYECLTGHPVFVRDDAAALLWAHLNDVPAPVSRRRNELRAADPVVAKALSKNPSERYQSCEQFAVALADALLTDRPRLSDTDTAERALPADILELDAEPFTEPFAQSCRAGPRYPPSVGMSYGVGSIDDTGGPGRSMTARLLTVFLVDDHEVVRRGVADLLDAEDDLTVIGQASSVADALARVPALRPDVAVLDMRLPDGNGVEMCRELRSRMPGLQCLILTSYTDQEAMVDAILAGAGGYVIKDIQGMDLVSAVRTVGSGTSLLDVRAVAALRERIRADAEGSGPLAGLTDQEKTVLTLIGDGLTNREIAERTSLGENTVKKSVSALLTKLGIHRRAQAAVVAAKFRTQGNRP
jgi:two-component system response regulator DevR